MSVKIYVDADACPVTKLAENIAEKFGIECTLVCDTAHKLQSSYSQVITTSKGRDCADFFLLKLVSKDDIVVTQDYGLAALVLSKGAYAINQNGMEYTEFNIDGLLNSRHIGAKVRRAGGRLKGPSKRTVLEDENFKTEFINLIEKVIKKQTF